MFMIPTQAPVLKTNKVGIVNTSWSISQISALKETLRIWYAKEKLPVFIRACLYIGVFVENCQYNARIFVILPVFVILCRIKALMNFSVNRSVTL